MTVAFLCLAALLSAFTLPVSAASPSTVDENPSTANGIVYFNGASWRGQTFIPQGTYFLNRVEIPLIGQGAGEGDFIISIQRTDANGFPTGPDLASGTVPVSSISTAWKPADWQSVDLGSGCVVEQGKTYAIVWRVPEDEGLYYRVNLSGLYSNGHLVKYDGTSWYNLRDWDALFRLYGHVVPGDAPIIAETGDQTVYRDTWIEFTIDASDPNGDALTYSAGNLPAGATFDAEERFFEWKQPAVPGMYDVTFTVSDGEFETSSTVAVTVKDLPPNQTIANLCPADSYNLILDNSGNPDFVILDIRTQEEFDSGYIDGATILDFYAEDFASQLAALDRNKTYFIYCRTGHRTGLALNMMTELGFTSVYNLEEGITAWIEAGNPTVTAENPTPTTTPPPSSGG